MINRNEEIEVLNYYRTPKYLATVSEPSGTKIDGAVDGQPGLIVITFGDIKNINSKSDAFRIGSLEIDESMKDEVYKELRIDTSNKNKNYFTRDEIIDIILDPTSEKLIKIIEIDSLNCIRNFVYILHELMYENEYDISGKISDYIEHRHEELKNFYENNQGSKNSTLPRPSLKTYKAKKEDVVEDEAEVENKEVEMAVVEEKPKKTLRNKSKK